ncbi:MAG: FtsX-like permease family protein [Candidatus Hydrogenedentes bacterium]|nr:FtsX-like permease family protein [Candidatus Hydrogenedentota bacterium]
MATNAVARKGIKRQIKLPNREAFKIALRSLKIRFWRSCVTMAGIVLAIAFLSSVMISGLATASLRPPDVGPGATVSEDRATQVWLICISLVVCTVGITNAMLMSVTERYREIGTMKCLGALDWFVVKLFLIEAAFQGLVGSMLGGLAGFIVAVLAAMTQYENVLGNLPWGTAFGQLGIAVLIGTGLSIVGAIYPARRAGRMPPADAMRTEI